MLKDEVLQSRKAALVLHLAELASSRSVDGV